MGRRRPARHARLVDNAAWGENQNQDEFMLQPGIIDAITEFWNWINDGAGSGGVGLHGGFNMAGSYDIWENARVAIERGERKLDDFGGELPGTEPPEEWQRYFQWQRDFGASEFGTQEWVEIAQKMYDWTGDNVFAIGTVGEAPAGPAHQQGPAQRPDRVPGLQHRLEGQPDVLGRPALVRPRITFPAT